MCFVWISEQTAIISLYSINWLVVITETECVYCAVRTECLHTIQVNASVCLVPVSATLHFIPSSRCQSAPAPTDCLHVRLWRRQRRLHHALSLVDANSSTRPTTAPCRHGHNLVYRFATLAPSSSFRFLVNPFERQQGQGVGGRGSAAMLLLLLLLLLLRGLGLEHASACSGS